MKQKRYINPRTGKTSGHQRPVRISQYRLKAEKLLAILPWVRKPQRMKDVTRDVLMGGTCVAVARSYGVKTPIIYQIVHNVCTEALSGEIIAPVKIRGPRK